MSQFSSFTDDFYNLGLGNKAKAAAGEQAQQAQQPQQEMGITDYAADAVLGIPRGLLGGMSDIADLATMPFGYDVPDRFGLMGESQSLAGGVTEGIASFMTGFIPGLGIAGKLGKLGKIGKIVKSIDKAADVAALSGNVTKARAIMGAQAFVKGSVAGAVADFAAFDGHEARLSNLLREHAGLTDPFTAYLAADETDGEIEGRLKNAIEGLAIGGLTEGLFNAFRMYKAGYMAKASGASPDAAMAAEQAVIRQEQREQLKKAIVGTEITDEQAEMGNLLIDSFGIGRKDLEIQGPGKAEGTYQEFAGGALEQNPLTTAVADESGKPLVMYHGTNAEFGKFTSRKDVGDGIYFSSNKDYAGGYAETKASMGGNARVVEANLEIKNPLILDGEDTALWEKYTQRGYDVRELEKQGYDGVMIKYADGETEAMVFNPEQIREVGAKPGEVKGFAAFAEDGRRIIGLLKGADFSTLAEEIAHVGRRNLFDPSVPAEARMGISNADIDVVSRWAGAEGGTWSVASEEKFAKGFLNYLRGGEAPEASLAGVFEKMADWMRNLYREIKGSDIDIEVSKEVREVFDKLMTKGPGFDRAGAAVNAGAPLLRQAAYDPTSPGLGKPSGSAGAAASGGSPYKPINLERFSSVDEINKAAADFIAEEPLASTLDAASPETLAKVIDDSQKDYQFIAAASGETSPLDFQRMLNTGAISAYDISRASRQLQGLRKFTASVGYRMTELSKKGSGASSEEMYEFLAGRVASAQAIQVIKEKQREVARMLGAMRINPAPDKAFTLLPPLPKTGELPASAASPSPAAAALSPAAASPSAGSVAGSPVTPNVVTIDPLMDPSMRAKVIAQTIEQAGGEEAVRATMAKFAAAAAAGGEEAVLKMSRGYRSGNALVEYWMNAILSGPVTHMVNMSANTLVALYLPMERAMGATLRGDMNTAKSAMRQYVYLANQFRDALQLAGVALKTDSNVLETIGTAERDQIGRALSAKGMGMAEDSIGGQAMNWAGSALNLPTRFLTAEDEFFKQLNYRASFMTELHLEGMTRFNGDARAAAQWAHETFDRVITDGQMYAEANVLKKAYSEADKAIAGGTITAGEKGDFVARFMADQKNWDPKLGALSQQALDRARYATFSTPLTTAPGAPFATRLAARMQAAANEHPMLRFVLPFIRTPTNLLNFTLERTFPTTLMNAKQAFGDYRKLLNHTDAAVRADAMGRLAFAGGAAFTVATAAYAGVITGGGPKNKAEREMKLATGWQPYSIKIGDKYVSYRREDPFSSIIGLVADVAEGYTYAEERHIEGFDKGLNIVVLAIARNITNKTYLTGITNISNALSNPEQFGQTLVNQYVGSMVPFSSALSQSVSTVADDPVIRDARTMLDAARSKVPFLAEDVAPRRNIFGEPMKRPTALGPDLLSPLTYTEVSDDKIVKEFDLLGHGFTPPKEQRGAIDLTQFQTKSGQMAYDRWLELHGQVRISGRTLREALLREINSRAYQKLSPASTDDYESPRIRQLRQVIMDYREAAYRQLLKESPALDRATHIDFANKQALRMGRNAQELIDLANR